MTYYLNHLIKTAGISACIFLTKKIVVAFIYGSIAKQEDTAKSDIDLMIIGEGISYAKIFRLMEKVEVQLGRKVNPTIYTAAEWVRKYNEGNNFVTKVLNQPKIYLMGTDREINSNRTLTHQAGY